MKLNEQFLEYLKYMNTTVKNDNQEGKHIGFKTANANQDRETTHSVAAEMDVTK